MKNSLYFILLASVTRNAFDGDTSKYTIRLHDVGKEIPVLQTKFHNEVDDRVQQIALEKEFNSVERVKNEVNIEDEEQKIKEQWKILRIFNNSGWTTHNASAEIFKKFKLDNKKDKHFKGYLFIF